MALTFDVNFTPATGAELFFRLKQRLVAAGWVLKGSGDGTSFSNVADTTSTPGTDYILFATTMQTSRSWYRLRMPAVGGVNREICVQRGTAGNYSWRIKVSASAGFVGGSASATVTPTATDEGVLAGGGTDASPTFVTLLPTTDGTYRAHVAADNASPYGLYYFTYPCGGGNPNGGLVVEPLTVPSGVTDLDPYVYYCSNNSANSFKCSPGGVDFSSETSVNAPRAYVNARASANFVTVPAVSGQLYGGIVSVIPGGLGPNPHSGKEDLFPILYARRSGLAAPNALKGYGTLMKWLGSTRTTGAALTQVSSKDYVVVGEVVLPWNGSSPVL